MTAPLVRARALAEQVRGVSYGKNDASDSPQPGFLPVLRAGNITDDGLVFNDLVFVPEIRVAEKQRIRRFDVLVVASSGSLDVVGKAAPALEDFNGAFGAFCKVLRPNPKVHPGYFAHFFKTLDYRRRVSALAAGANINNLRNEHLDDMEIPLPPLTEQQRISEVLDRAETLRAKRRAALAELDFLTQSIFFDLFLRSTPRCAFQVVEFGALAKRITYGFTCPMDHVSEGVPIITAKNIRRGYIDFQNCHRATEIQFKSLTEKCKPEQGDLLITKDGAIRGRCAIVNTKSRFCISQAVALVRPDFAYVTSEYLWGFIVSERIQRKIMDMDKGAAMPHLQITELARFPVPLPSLDLQREYAHRIAVLEKLKTAQNASLAELDALFASLQHRAFRGEL